MDDEAIVELYFARAEEAIAETSKKYGAYLYQMAWNLLKNSCDAEEAVSDTYLDAWNTIPPTRPRILRHFLSRITRNAALDRLDYRKAKKEVETALWRNWMNVSLTVELTPRRSWRPGNSVCC